MYNKRIKEWNDFYMENKTILKTFIETLKFDSNDEEF